jgi:hypothetical protein
MHANAFACLTIGHAAFENAAQAHAVFDLVADALQTSFTQIGAAAYVTELAFAFADASF